MPSFEKDESSSKSTSTSTLDELDVSQHGRRESWYIPASLASDATLNPIRAIVDKIALPRNHKNKLIPLSIGDPTVLSENKHQSSAQHTNIPTQITHTIKLASSYASSSADID